MQKIEICYRYVGCLEPTTITFENTVYKTRYADRTCQICGKTYTPTTSRQKFCIE